MDLEGDFLARKQDNKQIDTLIAIGTIPANGFPEIADLAESVGGSGQGGGIYLEATARAANMPATP